MLNARLLFAGFLGQSLYLNAQIALAEAPPDPPSRPEANAPMGEATPAQTFVSDGQALNLESLGVTITPPAGWEVSTNSGGLSVVMKEPRQEAPAYDKPKYQRNITVAAIHQASPIDEKRATELRDELTRNFTQSSLVSRFQIVEHKFFDYRAKGDGLLVYSTLNLGEHPMMQMHVLVSGGAKQFLMTYTDLADRFSDAKDGAFEAAWSSMVSATVTGETPSRWSLYRPYALAAGGLTLIGLALFFWRYKARKRDFKGEADQLLEADDGASPSLLSTLADGWRLNGGATSHAVSQVELQSASTPAPRRRMFRRTRQDADFVSFA